MPQAIEAEIDENGHIALKEALHLHGKTRALLIILDPPEKREQTALLSELVLGEDWNRPEEDQAWEAFQ